MLFEVNGVRRRATESGGNKAIEKSELNDEIYDSWQESKEQRGRESERIVECEQEVSRDERDQTDLDKRVQSISFENYTDT